MEYMLVRVLKPLGYYVEHKVGETLRIPLRNVTELIQEGFVEIVVNNVGNNLGYDDPEHDPLGNYPPPIPQEAEAPTNE